MLVFFGLVVVQELVEGLSRVLGPEVLVRHELLLELSGLGLNELLVRVDLS